MSANHFINPKLWAEGIYEKQQQHYSRFKIVTLIWIARNDSVEEIFILFFDAY